MSRASTATGYPTVTWGHARSRHRRHRPLADRPRRQGIAAAISAPTTSPPPSSRPRSTRCRSSTRTLIDDLYLGCGLPGGEQGFNMARVVAVSLGLDQLPGATITRYCSSSLQTTRMAFHAIKAGEGDVFISAGVETVSRFARGSSDGAAAGGPGAGRRRLAEPEVRRGPGPLRPSAPRAAPRPGTTRATDGAVPGRLPGDGPDRGEPRPGRERHPRGDGRVRRTQPEQRREGDRRRLLGPRDHAR